MPFFHRLTAALGAGLLPLAAQALCTSDGVPQPSMVLERFIQADCEACWRDPATPKAAPGTLALDWVLPSARGESAPLSAVALPEALERLSFLRHPEPATSNAFSGLRQGAPVELRLAQGEPFNDYIGASIDLRTPGREIWRAWLLLVESLPAGTEFSPVARNLVRNVFRPDWHRPLARGPGRLAETRSIQIHEGARPQRLRLVALLHDGSNRIRAIALTECR